MEIARVLTRQGIDLAANFLDQVRNGDAARPPLLDWETDGFEYPLQPYVELEQRIFRDRLDLGEYLVSVFDIAGARDADITGERGLWTWLAMWLFEQLCPELIDARRVVRDNPKYICAAFSDYQSHYRHLVATPYRLVRLHGDAARVFLQNVALPVSGEIVEQIASRQEIISNRALIRAFSNLYYDPARQRFKAGATTQERPGAVRRFVEVWDQFRVTYDLYAMQPDQILELLPAEFDSWH